MSLSLPASGPTNPQNRPRTLSDFSTLALNSNPRRLRSLRRRFATGHYQVDAVAISRQIAEYYDPSQER